MKALALALIMAALPALAAPIEVSVGSLLATVIYLVIVALIFWAIWWFVGYVGVPEPFHKIILVVIGLVALIVVINVLLSLIGQPLFRF